MVTPRDGLRLRSQADQLTTLKVQEIPSGYDPSQYVTERLMLRPRDGKQVPGLDRLQEGLQEGRQPAAVPLRLWRLRLRHPAQLLLAGSACSTAAFAYAIAHIRGGDDMGYGWYLDGTAKNRWNTFHDFVDAAKGLNAAGFAKPGKIAIAGRLGRRQADGCRRQHRPQLWGAVIADVPFVRCH
jgi:oligopeptidase B